MAASSTDYTVERAYYLRRPAGALALFWPPIAGFDVLVVEVFSGKSSSDLFAYGVDPRNKAAVFSATVTSGVLTGLVAAITGTRKVEINPVGYDPDGNAMTEVDLGPEGSVVVISGPGPGGTGPNMTVVVILAVAIAADVELTNAAVDSEYDLNRQTDSLSVTKR